jgi:hypothetical protein
MGRALLSKDFLAGSLYMAFGLLGLWLGRTLESGSADAMGAGYFPRLVCSLLLIIGASLAATSLMRGGEGVEPGHWRPFTLVTLSSLAFALLLHPLGLVLTLVLTIALACLAEGPVRPIPFLVLSSILIAANVGIFVLALRIPIPLWPAAF